VLTAGDLANLVDQLRRVDRNAPDAELIDQITELERIKSACAAAQATLTLAFVTSQTEGLTPTQQRHTRAHRSINAQIALARHDSPTRGGRHVGAATALLREMPNTYQALRTGEATTEPDGTTITLTTPTGHQISTQPPTPPQSPGWETQPAKIIEIITAPTHPIEINLTKASCAFWWAATALISKTVTAQPSAEEGRLNQLLGVPGPGGSDLGAT